MARALLATAVRHTMLWSVTALLCSVSLASMMPGCRSSPYPTPVLLVSIDALRADRLNSYGYAEREVSPRLDALARDGILFERHIASAPWTTPSHVSLLTSLRPTAHGVTQPFGLLNRGLLGKAGIPTLAADVPTLPEILAEHGWSNAAFTGGATLDPRIGFGRGFASYDTSQYKLRKRTMEPLFRFIETTREEPFLLFWHTFEVHAPYISGQFLSDVLPRERADALGLQLRRLRKKDQPSTAAGREILERNKAFHVEIASALYDGGVLSTDRWLGRVLDRLRALDLYDQMLIVVTSDHGEQLGERDRRFYDIHGRTLYDEMIRIPLIIKLPGQAFAGTRVSATTRAIDVMPTILDVVRVPVEGLDLQGLSLRSSWEEPGTIIHRHALSEAVLEPFELKSVTWGAHRYIVRSSKEQVSRHGRAHVPSAPSGVELFDLTEDPEEEHNLLAPGRLDASGATAPLAAALEGKLRALVTEKQRPPIDTHTDPGTLEALRALGYVEDEAPAAAQPPDERHE